jgi:hypothetical protein
MLPPFEKRVQAQELLELGYRSISNKYRTIARLPPGKTALEALSEVDPEFAERILSQAADRMTEYYLRVHARQAGDVLELEPEAFSAFKRAERGPR